MIACRLAKAVMENEEGLNHLWIRWVPEGETSGVRIRISLPKGIYRKRNSSGYRESESGEIRIARRPGVHDIIVELFTSQPTPPGARTIVVSARREEDERVCERFRHSVTLEVLLEEDIGDVPVDPEVLRLVKSLEPEWEGEPNDRIERLLPPQVITIDPNKLSDLEKKYRVDFNGPAWPTPGGADRCH